MSTLMTLLYLGVILFVLAAVVGLFQGVESDTLMWGATLGFHLSGGALLAFSLALPDAAAKQTLLILSASILVVGNTGLLYYISEHITD